MTSTDLATPRRRALRDALGRVATDLRISLTDRCNLRCTYCMPAEGLAWLPRQEILADDEVMRLVRVAVDRLGVTAVRFTGGEPLLRPGLEQIVSGTRALGAHVDIAMTTNGIGLARRVDALVEAGLDRVNVSLDTLRPERFRQLTRRDRLADVLAGLEAAARAGIAPVKVNAVLMRGVNDDEAVELVRFCLDRGYAPRFIEQMPIDADRRWSRGELVTAQEILADLGREYDLVGVEHGRGSAPAQEYLVDGGPATVGVIASVTRPFCGACDRTRVTADGQVRSCLFATSETDLRTLLRGGAGDDEIAERWCAAMWGKTFAHGGAEPYAFADASRSMSAIGG